jgi:hypothetical protein
MDAEFSVLLNCCLELDGRHGVLEGRKVSFTYSSLTLLSCVLVSFTEDGHQASLIIINRR